MWNRGCKSRVARVATEERHHPQRSCLLRLQSAMKTTEHQRLRFLHIIASALHARSTVRHSTNTHLPSDFPLQQRRQQSD
jgi:hypothetical protein